MKLAKQTSLERLYLKRAMRLVNGVENLCDQYWAIVEKIVDKETERAHLAMRRLIAALPEHPDPGWKGTIDFRTPAGLKRREKFMQDMRKVYEKWWRGIKSATGFPVQSLRPEPWEVSLGLIQLRPGELLMRLRDEIVRKAHALAHLLDTFPSQGDVFEARVRTRGVVSARITGRGLKKEHTSHSRATSIILRGLKGIISDQEKALLENALRGLDQLPRNHANKLFDAVTGIPLRDALNAVADDFSTGSMNKRQLKLSIQTHIRAMIRRLATEAEEIGDIPGMMRYVQIPPTRRKDMVGKVSGTSEERVFKILDGPSVVRKGKGSGDSLGLHPGDRTIPLPFPKNYLDKLMAEAVKKRKQYLKARGRKK